MRLLKHSMQQHIWEINAMLCDAVNMCTAHLQCEVLRIELGGVVGLKTLPSRQIQTLRLYATDFGVDTVCFHPHLPV